MTKVILRYWAKPIPIRRYDWEAWFKDDEGNEDSPNFAYGYGRNESEAIQDLVDDAEFKRGDLITVTSWEVSR